MTDPHARSRQAAGQPTGGQFATEARGTDTGVDLTQSEASRWQQQETRHLLTARRERITEGIVRMRHEAAYTAGQELATKAREEWPDGHYIVLARHFDPDDPPTGTWRVERVNDDRDHPLYRRPQKGSGWGDDDPEVTELAALATATFDDDHGTEPDPTDIHLIAHDSNLINFREPTVVDAASNGELIGTHTYAYTSTGGGGAYVFTTKEAREKFVIDAAAETWDSLDEDAQEDWGEPPTTADDAVWFMSEHNTDTDYTIF